MGINALGHNDGDTDSKVKQADGTVVNGQKRGIRGLLSRVLGKGDNNGAPQQCPPPMSQQALYEWDCDKAARKARGDSEWF